MTVMPVPADLAQLGEVARATSHATWRASRADFKSGMYAG